MATTLAAVRTAFQTALAEIPGVEVYRMRPTNPQYPCFVVGWPASMDVRPAMGDVRTFVIDVWVGVQVGDDESTDDLLCDLIDSAVDVLLADAAQDVQPATDFGTELLADDRRVLWCRIPVEHYA